MTHEISVSTVGGFHYPPAPYDRSWDSDPKMIADDEDLYLYLGGVGPIGSIHTNLDERDAMHPDERDANIRLAKALCDLGTLLTDVADGLDRTEEAKRIWKVFRKRGRGSDGK